MLANKQGSAQQRQSVDALLARLLAPALRLNPSEAIWRPSTTSSGRLYSTGISLLHARQWSTVLPNRPPPACTFARWHSVVGSWAPGLIYAVIFSCDIPRISFAFRSRAPNPYRSTSVVDCRRRWRTSMGVTITQSCVSGDGREKGSMRLPCVPRRPSDVRLRRTGKNWKGWRFSSTWGGSSRMMMPTPRPFG
jgi:hypothetical protein